MTEPASALDQFEQATSRADAERALDALSPGELPDDVSLGDLYDDLASGAAEDGDHALAIRAQRKALEHGCSFEELGREKLAWYLLKDGQRDAGEELFSKLRREHGEDPFFLLTLANARADAGHAEAALLAFDEALAAAKERDDEDTVEQVRDERAQYRADRGIEPDEDDAVASPGPGGPGRAELWTLAWFPPAERERASALWPELASDLQNDESYRRSLETELRVLSSQSSRHPRLVALEVDGLVAFADREGLEAGRASTRNRYAADQRDAGAGEQWPPGRNDPCWCGSGRKYKRCCAAL